MEALELPVGDHLHLLSSQFLARTLDPSHVSYPFTTLDQGPRKLKHTLRSKCIEDVRPYLENDGTFSRGNFNKVKNKLHCKKGRESLWQQLCHRLQTASDKQ